MSDELRIRIPTGPNQRKQTLEIMNELARRVQAEQEAEKQRKEIETENHEIIDGEVLDGDQDGWRS